VLAISRSPISAESSRRHGLGAAFGYACAGFAAAWRSQQNLRIHTLLASGVVVAGVVWRIPPMWWALVAVAGGLVVCAELVNTAIEAAVDLASPDEHPLAKQAKDVAAAAVLVAALIAVCVGIALAVWVIDRR
jgi:undecaprenol kinase